MEKLFNNSLFNGIIFIVMVALGLLVGGFLCYVGIWEWMIGGIIDIVNAVKMDPVPAPMLAKGIAKAVFFEIPVFFGIVAMWLCVSLGASALK